MRAAGPRCALLAWLSLPACAPTSQASSPQIARDVPTTSACPGGTFAPNPPASVAPALPSPPAETPQPCGELACLAFSTPEAAFDYVLLSEPRILAVGEAHAQEGTPGIASSTHRFAEQLLPKLAGRSRHLVIELLVANCKRETVERVSARQAPVTEHQAKGNQNDFLTLGKFAKRLGIEPEALTPECAEYEAVVAAGKDSISGLLGLIARQTTKQVETLLAKPENPTDIIVSYGGALHNDLHPRPGQEAWSFGPKLAEDSRNRYLELDLIVPEFVKDSAAWRNLPWFSAFDREHLRRETLLYRAAPNSFVLIFPKTDNNRPAGL